MSHSILRASGFSTPSATRVRPEAFGYRDEGAHDYLVLVVRVEILYEEPVDLDLVEGEAMQVAQGGIARPEIVYRDS